MSLEMYVDPNIRANYNNEVLYVGLKDFCVRKEWYYVVEKN